MLMMRRLRHSVVTGARRSFATQHRSVRVEVADGVKLHALVPEASNAAPVLCLPSAFGTPMRVCTHVCVDDALQKTNS